MSIKRRGTHPGKWNYWKEMLPNVGRDGEEVVSCKILSAGNVEANSDGLSLHQRLVDMDLRLPPSHPMLSVAGGKTKGLVPRPRPENKSEKNHYDRIAVRVLQGYARARCKMG